MIVELVGLAGSGKSTFARVLEKEGKWVRARMGGRLELLWYAKLFCLRHPITALKQLLWLVRYRGHHTLWYTKFINLFLVHNAKYMKASMLPFAILDQGHLQNTISLFDTNVSREVLAAYVALLPHPDVAVFFDISKEERVRRQAERGYGTRESITLQIRESWESASEENFATLFDLSRQFQFTRFVLTEGDEEKVRQVLANLRLWRFVMHLRMPTEKAHGLQIAKTLEALMGAGEYVELWVPRRNNAIHEDVFTYYALTKHFPVRTVASWEALRLVGVLGSLAYWLDAALFVGSLLLMRIDTGAIYYTRSAPVAWLLGMKGARVYYEAHLWPSSKEGYFRYLLRGVVGIVANSEGTARMFAKNGFANVEVIRNGADLQKFTIPMTHTLARREVGLPTVGSIIMYVGSFAKWKGVATLCAAWKKMKHEFPDTTLVLVGGVTETLLQFSACHNIAHDKSMIIVPHQPSAVVPAYLRAATILVLPNEPVSEESIHYTSPIKLFEYMASGRPVVVSDLPSMREVLDDSTATFFSAGDSEDLAQQLSSLLHDTKRGDEKAQNASQLVEKYSWEKRAEYLITYIVTHGKDI